MVELELDAEAVDAVLPKEPASEHEAWTKVRLSNSAKWPLVCFKYGSGPSKIYFQTTVAACGSQELAERIGRACFLKFEAGATVDEALQFRKELYDKLKELRNPGGKPKARRRNKGTGGVAGPLGLPLSQDVTGVTEEEIKSSPSSAAATKVSPPLTSPIDEAAAMVEGGSAATVTAAPSPPPTPAGGAIEGCATTDVLEDAAADSPAWQAVKFRPSANAARMLWPMPDGSTANFQTTFAKAGNSAEEALRIGRLCYVKLVAGISVEEVKSYREQLYKIACSRKAGVESAGAAQPLSAETVKRRTEGEVADVAPPKKRRTSLGNNEAMNALKRQGKLQGALRIEGRELGKKNSSINGVYTRLECGFGGMVAYEKVGDKRFIYFSTGKSRWVLNKELGGDAKGFAYLQVDDGGIKPPLNVSGELLWHVFDGKDKGYNKDPNMRCTLVTEAVSSTVTQEQSAELSFAEEKNSSSSVSSSDSDDNAPFASGADELPPPSLAVPMRGLAPHSSGTHVEPVRPRGMVCAKMMSRSLLRCRCHFMHHKHCPSRGS